MFVCGSQVAPPSGLQNKTRLLVGSEVLQPLALHSEDTGALSNRTVFKKLFCNSAFLSEMTRYNFTFKFIDMHQVLFKMRQKYTRTSLSFHSAVASI